jgi:hypothetical protein
MKTQRRAEIIFEASRTIIYTARYQRGTKWCPSCGTDVEMITASEAAGVAGVSSYIIYGWAETGRLHHRATAAGALLICLKSLSVFETLKERFE